MSMKSDQDKWTVEISLVSRSRKLLTFRVSVSFVATEDAVRGRKSTN